MRRSSLSVLLLALCAAAQTTKITARQAKEHIGETQTVPQCDGTGEIEVGGEGG